jgi:hypothetical protein
LRKARGQISARLKAIISRECLVAPRRPFKRAGVDQKFLAARGWATAIAVAPDSIH